MNITVTAKPKSEHVAGLREQLNRISECIKEGIGMDAINEIGQCLDELELWLEDPRWQAVPGKPRNL